MPTKYDYFTSLPPFGSLTCDCGTPSGIANITDKICSNSTSKSEITDCINVLKAHPAYEPNKATIVLMPESKPPMPEVIMEREKKGGHYTTIKWTDGTYTTVKASEGDEGERSAYMAFCAALAKKIYGSNSAVHRVVNRHMETHIKAEKQKAAAAKRAKEREAEQAAHERALLREAKRLRLKDEAKAYNRAHRMDEE